MAFKELEKVEGERREKEREEYSRQKTGWEKVKKKKKGRKAVPNGTASNEMCTFLILNISSLQLIPVNIIAFRSQYGSSNPAAIVGPAIMATMVSTLVAVVFCKVME